MKHLLWGDQKSAAQQGTRPLEEFFKAALTSFTEAAQVGLRLEIFGLLVVSHVVWRIDLTAPIPCQ